MNDKIETKKSETLAVKANNIKFIGKSKEAPHWIRTDNRLLKLPGSDNQKKGFYHEEASLIINTFPQHYKAITKLGE